MKGVIECEGYGKMCWGLGEVGKNVGLHENLMRTICRKDHLTRNMLRGVGVGSLENGGGRGVSRSKTPTPNFPDPNP